MPLDIPMLPPPAFVASSIAVVSSRVTPSEAENVVAAAWLDLYRDQTFVRFCQRHHAGPGSLIAHPNGTFSLRSVDGEGTTETHFRPFDAQGHLVAPFTLEADAPRWQPSLDVLLRYTQALSRDVGHDAVGVSRLNGFSMDRVLERAGHVGEGVMRMQSAMRFLELFAALYRDEKSLPDVRRSTDDVRYTMTFDAFVGRFDAEADLRYLTGWATGLAEEEVSPRVSLRMLGKLAAYLRSTYAEGIVLPGIDSEGRRQSFIDMMRATVVSVAAGRGMALDAGTVDFAANVLWCIHQDDMKVRPLASALPAPLPDYPVTVPESPVSSSPPIHPVDVPAVPHATLSIDVPADVDDTHRSSPGDTSGHPWTMVVKVATVTGVVLVFGAGTVTALTASQKTAVVLLGNAAAAAGATVLAIMVPGAENIAGAVGTSGLVYSSGVDYLISEGVAPQLAKSAAVVEVLGVYILVSVGVKQSYEALDTLKKHPGWREALKATGSILATIGTLAAGTPAADKADQANVEDPQYRFFNKHPDAPERLGHTGNGAVLVGVGVLHTVDEIPRDEATSSKEESMSWWQMLLSFFDPSGSPSTIWPQ